MEEQTDKIEPRTFRDYDGREWSILITIPEVARIKKAMGVNVLDLVDVQSKLFAAVTSDVVQLCDLLYLICKPAADRAGISDEQFGQGMRGDAISDALDCLFLACCDFFPKERRRLLTDLHAKLNRYGEEAIRLASEELTRPETDEEVSRNVSTWFGLGVSASGSLVDSALTPTESQV